MPENTDKVKTIKKDEIDVLDVLKKIWKGRKTLYICIVTFFLLGLIIVVSTPKEYKSEATLLVETGSKTSGMPGALQQLGGLAGISFGGTSGADALTPELYPDIIKNIPFLLELLDQKVTESKYDSTLTVAQYIDRYTRSSLLSKILGYTFGFPGKIISSLKGHQPSIVDHQLKHGSFRLTNKQFSLINSLSGRIIAQKGGSKSSNTLIISVEMQDPFVAAQLNDSVVRSLQRYIIDYRTQKAKTDLKFVMNQYAEAENRYLKAQQILADYRDQHKNVIMASSRNEEDRLQSEYNLAFANYSSLSQQLEQSKMRVQENTPVFSVLNPAMVPLQKSKPHSFILIMMVFLGSVVGVVIIYGKHIYKAYFKS